MPLIDAARFYARHHGKGIKHKSVALAVDEMIGTAPAGGWGRFHCLLRGTFIGTTLGAVSGAMANQVRACSGVASSAEVLLFQLDGGGRARDVLCGDALLPGLDSVFHTVQKSIQSDLGFACTRTDELIGGGHMY